MPPTLRPKSASDDTEAVPPIGSRTWTLKTEAIDHFKTSSHAHAYTSPQFLTRLIESRVSELDYHTNCSYHEWVTGTDSLSDTNSKTPLLVFLCRSCRVHFQLSVTKEYDKPVGHLKHPRHMLIPCRSSAQGDLNKKRASLNRTATASFICAVPGCFHTVVLQLAPPVLSNDDVAKFEDSRRTLRNLKAARLDDPQRYEGTTDDYGANAVDNMMTYLKDTLNQEPGQGNAKKIKKRNKRFKVSFGHDFDDLFQRIGFVDRIDEAGEECWFLPVLDGSFDETTGRTPGHTVRAALEEICVLDGKTKPVWDRLLDILNAHYSSVSIVDATETDLSLLGCLKDFPTSWYSWSAITLAELCPSRRNEFLEAGLRCCNKKNDGDAATEIVMYSSQFDSEPSLGNPQFQAAVEFFGVAQKSSSELNELDWISQYRITTGPASTDETRAQAYQHLEAVGNTLSKDLLGELARSESMDTLEPFRANTEQNRRLSIGSAARILGVEASYTAEMIAEASQHVDAQTPPSKVVEALTVLAELKHNQDKPSEAQALYHAADMWSTSLNGQGTVPGLIQSNSWENETTFATPPGLRNIGNTCYLNSLLQYFYNVRTIREMVLTFDQIKIDIDGPDVGKRRTGGNGTPVTLEEAIVARQFVEELRRLFVELQSTTDAAACPSQKLANTALSSAKEILSSTTRNTPPPLPARPSTVEPLTPPPEDVDMVNVSVEPVDEKNDTASTRSSVTLVSDSVDAQPHLVVPIPSLKENKVVDIILTEQEANGETTASDQHSEHVEHIEHTQHRRDVEMTDVLNRSILDEKIAQISRRLEHSDRSGTSQQDVEEIIGNILEHFMRAIRPDGPMADKPELQADIITKTFFTTIVNTTTKSTLSQNTTTNGLSIHNQDSVHNEEIVPERWITAFPHADRNSKIQSSLYQALDRYFAYEQLSDPDIGRYATIRTLPPIVHICIQRSDADGIKNRNPVTIEEDLYLDCYMEVKKGTSAWNERQRWYAIQARKKDLESRAALTTAAAFKRPESNAWQQYAAEEALNYSASEEVSEEDRWPTDSDDTLLSDIARPLKRTTLQAQLKESDGCRSLKRRSLSPEGDHPKPKPVDQLFKMSQREDDFAAAELLDLEREEKGLREGTKRHKYCLHAVICHSGGMNAGHYWVWIRDFNKQVWYRFNDSIVTEDSRPSHELLEELSNSGDPYYLAYIEDDSKDELVEVPQRKGNKDDNGADRNGNDVEMEVIDGVAVDGLMSPANQG
ncbi:cysteine proteinase [Xylariaceae sp. FL1019]|nr:cysteine proteinase [Xylariaceae sp. FL1019]